MVEMDPTGIVLRVPSIDLLSADDKLMVDILRSHLRRNLGMTLVVAENLE
jgi:hypothetical protein